MLAVVSAGETAVSICDQFQQCRSPPVVAAEVGRGGDGNKGCSPVVAAEVGRGGGDGTKGWLHCWQWMRYKLGQILRCLR